jgi:type IX secretion system PorP/SprF family membrane protein
MRFNPFCTFLFVLHYGHSLMAQQDLSYSQYMNAKYFYNPATLLDESNIVAVTIFNRNQWTVLDHEFNSQALAINTSISQDRIGIGLQLQSDRNPTFRVSEFQIPLNYRVNLQKGNLSFGLEPSIKLVSNHDINVLAKDPNDALLDRKTTWGADFATGAYYVHNRYYLGFSSKNILGQGRAGLLKKPSRYFFGACVIGLSNKISLLPSILVKTQDNKYSLDVGANLKINRGVMLGAQVKNHKQINVQAAILLNSIFTKISNQCTLGYAYETGFSSLYEQAGGTHEILIKYYLKKRPSVNEILKKRPTISPLFF